MLNKARIIAVLIAVALLSACVGGGGKSADVQAEIEKLFDRYAAHMRMQNPKLDSAELASLYHYPVTLISESGYESVIETKSDAVDIFLISVIVGLMGPYESVEIIVGKVTHSSTTAAVAATIKTVKVKNDVRQQEISQKEFKFVKVGGNWLIKEEKTISSTVVNL